MPQTPSLESLDAARAKQDALKCKRFASSAKTEINRRIVEELDGSAPPSKAPREIKRVARQLLENYEGSGGMNTAIRTLAHLIAKGLKPSFVQEAARWKIAGRLEELTDIKRKTRSFRGFRDRVAANFKPLNKETRGLRQGRGFASRSGDGYVNLLLTVEQMRVLNNAAADVLKGGTADTPKQRGEVIVTIARRWMKARRTSSVKS